MISCFGYPENVNGIVSELQYVVVLKDWENRQSLPESLQDLFKPCVDKCMCKYLCSNQNLDSCVCGVLAWCCLGIGCVVQNTGIVGCAMS
jgi:hypothetical protein